MSASFGGSEKGPFDVGAKEVGGAGILARGEEGEDLLLALHCSAGCRDQLKQVRRRYVGTSTVKREKGRERKSLNVITRLEVDVCNGRQPRNH